MKIEIIVEDATPPALPGSGRTPAQALTLRLVRKSLLRGAFGGPPAHIARLLPRLLRSEYLYREEGDEIHLSFPDDPTLRVLIVDALATPGCYARPNDATLWVPVKKDLALFVSAGRPDLDGEIPPLIRECLGCPTPLAHIIPVQTVARLAGADPRTIDHAAARPKSKSPTQAIDPLQRSVEGFERLIDSLMDGCITPFAQMFAKKVLAWRPSTGEEPAFTKATASAVVSDLDALEAQIAETYVRRNAAFDNSAVPDNQRALHIHLAREILKRAYPETFSAPLAAKALFAVECRADLAFWNTYGDPPLVKEYTTERIIMDIIDALQARYDANLASGASPAGTDGGLA